MAIEVPNYPSKNTMQQAVPVSDVQRVKEPDKVKAVANAKIKKTRFKRFLSIFFEEDIENIKDYIFEDVICKGIKDLTFEAIRIFFYGSRRPSGGGGFARRGNVSYDRYYEDRVTSVRSVPRAVPRTSSFDIQSISFDSRAEAQVVLDQMVDYLGDYNRVSVARLYDFSGLTPPAQANKFGWFSLNGSEVITVEDGYGLRMPKPEPLN